METVTKAELMDFEIIVDDMYLPWEFKLPRDPDITRIGEKLTF